MTDPEMTVSDIPWQSIVSTEDRGNGPEVTVLTYENKIWMKPDHAEDFARAIIERANKARAGV